MAETNRELLANLEVLERTAPTTVDETDKGIEFKNNLGETVFVIPIAGTED